SPFRRRSRWARIRRAAAEEANGGVVGLLAISACSDMYTHPVSSLPCALNLPDSPWAYIPGVCPFGLGHQRMASRVSARLSPARCRMPLGNDVIPHTLRHTAATWLRQVLALPRWLGFFYSY